MDRNAARKALQNGYTELRKGHQGKEIAVLDEIMKASLTNEPYSLKKATYKNERRSLCRRKIAVLDEIMKASLTDQPYKGYKNLYKKRTYIVSALVDLEEWLLKALQNHWQKVIPVDFTIEM